MSKIALFVVLAVAACLIPDAMSACSSSQLSNLESQIETCSAGIYGFGGYWRWARSVAGAMRRESTCELDHAVGYYQSILRGEGEISRLQIDSAVTCLKNSISYGICC